MAFFNHKRPLSLWNKASAFMWHTFACHEICGCMPLHTRPVTSRALLPGTNGGTAGIERTCWQRLFALIRWRLESILASITARLDASEFSLWSHVTFIALSRFYFPLRLSSEDLGCISGPLSWWGAILNGFSMEYSLVL